MRNDKHEQGIVLRGADEFFSTYSFRQNADPGEEEWDNTCINIQRSSSIVSVLKGFFFWPPYWNLIFIRMKGLMRFSGALALSCLALESAARAVGYTPKDMIIPYKREPLQNIVSEYRGVIQSLRNPN